MTKVQIQEAIAMVIKVLDLGKVVFSSNKQLADIIDVVEVMLKKEYTPDVILFIVNIFVRSNVTKEMVMNALYVNEV